VEPLDEEKIDLLRRWGEGLERDGRDELRAAGRAIMLLIEEIERLHVELWSLRSSAPAREEELPASLLARLTHLGRRGGEAPG
jgi:hypothetical protein